MNWNIVAHGGGDRKESIRHALDLSGVNDPRILLIPSSSTTEEKFDLRVGKIQSSFGEFGLVTYLLHEFGENPSKTKIDEEIGRADLMYTIGGNSPHMLSTIKRHGSDVAIYNAIMDGKVHAGTSAGALLPFELGHSNPSANDTEEEWDYKYLPMLGVLSGVVTAHANMHDNTPHGKRPETRMEALMNTFPANINHGFAIENNVALIVNGERPPYVVRSEKSANVYYISRDSSGNIVSNAIGNTL